MDTALPYALYALHGKDAADFLQGQLTCDMREMANGGWRFAAYCSPQGKVLATMMVAFDGECYWLALPADLAEKTVTRLKMFVLRSDVRMESRAERLYTVAAEARAQGVRQEGDALWLDGMAGLSLCIAMQQPQEALSAAQFACARMAAGIAEITLATADQFLPQMLDLQKIGALSFRKGCYVGQEAVARLEYKSVNRRLLACAQGASPPLPAAGDALLADGLRAGTVLSAAFSNGHVQVQAVIQDRYLDQPLHVAGLPDPLSFHPAHPETA
ncbi:MAG: hypothetical protein Q4A06_06585 [Cardiobacteriaceae bacterium]|nr:hypothetical protein [Cardiobacteriaceae bacterium]